MVNKNEKATIGKRLKKKKKQRAKKSHSLEKTEVCCLVFVVYVKGLRLISNGAVVGERR